MKKPKSVTTRKEQIKAYWNRFIGFLESHDKLVAGVGAIALVVFTAILAGATIFLYLATRNLVTDAERTAKRQLRAYVYAAPYRAFNIDSSGATAQIYTIIGSKGSTFAHNVQRWVGINLLAGPVPERFEDFGTLKREEGAYVLAPGADGFVIQTFRTLSADELAKLMTPTGELRFYAFGKITYDDEFGAPHTTTFCHVYFGPERLDRGNDQFAYENWQAKFCDRHNEAD